jgi:hypothetical protein
MTKLSIFYETVKIFYFGQFSGFHHTKFKKTCTNTNFDTGCHQKHQETELGKQIFFDRVSREPPPKFEFRRQKI